MKTDSNKKIIWKLLYFCISFAYLEIIIHIGVYGKLDKGILFPCVFAIGFGLLCAVITSVFPKPVNRVTGYICAVATSIYYVVQLIYFKIFNTFLSLVAVSGAEDAMNFKTVLFDRLKENLWLVLLLVIPVIVLIVMDVKVNCFEKSNWKWILSGACTVSLYGVLAVLSLGLAGKEPYSPYNLFHGRFVMELSMEKLGVFVTTIQDAGTMIFGHKTEVAFAFQEESAVNDYDEEESEDYVEDDELQNQPESQTEEPVKKHIDESIDLAAIYNDSDDETIKNIAAYLSSKEAAEENEYTGIFKDYNVVFVTAESLSPFGVSKECTPTLYKIMNEGFSFGNFYNPRWYHSTIDGEYVNCLSQYPDSTEWSFYKSAKTYQPYALGNALNNVGYESFAYHDFNFYYYNRSETHANMGYDFKAIDYGLEIPYNTTYSDLDTMEAVCDEFIGCDKFNMYFMSFSGHLPYDYSLQAMCLKNREECEKLTADWGLSEEATAYIAAQMELDKAMEYLIERLKQADKLDKTVFIITSDHYPYGLSSGILDELAGCQIEDDPFETHRGYLGIWSASMTENVKTDKYCASVDVLPTVLNMLGVEYDSRFLAGNDIFSDAQELVIFADHSFITDRVKYNTSKGTATYLVDEKKVSDGYINETIQKVENIIYISDAIVEKDFFGIAYNKKTVSK